MRSTAAKRAGMMLSVTATFYLAACQWPFRPVASETVSPKGIYTVRLKGHLTAPRSPFIEHLVYAEVFKDEKVIINGHEVHFADWFDTSFEDCYMEGEWIAENALAFRAEVRERYVGSDEIVIENRSAKVLKFLKVKTYDLFLGFEISPGSSIRFPATPQGPLTDHGWISVAGELADGTLLRPLEQNVPLSVGKEDRFRYVVVIEKSSIVLKEVAKLPQSRMH